MSGNEAYSASGGRRRRKRRGDRQKESKTDQFGRGNGDGTNAVGKLEKFWHQSIRQGLAQRPNCEWDFRDFTVTVAKADQQAIGEGIEKMFSERRCIASYNWDEKSWFPTIVVPGAPKIFYPWSGGLLGDRNEVMTIDEESFRIPKSPMEPLFTAVRICQPNFKLGDVDVVADLNCFKKLIRFVLRAAFVPVTEDDDAEFAAKMDDIERNVFAGANQDCDFRIDCQVIGNTVVLMRRETEHRGRAMGFGVAYLDACTKPYDVDPKAAGPHKRVTFLKFGTLRLLLRHKTLAAVYPESLDNVNVGNRNKIAAASNGGGDGWPAVVDCSAIRYIRGGYLGDHNELKSIEFASISKLKGRLVVDKWLDMLFIGSDSLYLGEHTHGRFDRPSLRTRSEALDLSGLQPSDGRRILYILEMLLKKIIRYGQRPCASGDRDRRESGDGGGDGSGREAPVSNEPRWFTIVSSNECRKLALYKGRLEKNNPRSDATSPACVSDAMMAALLADDDTVAQRQQNVSQCDF